jgi:uncharacterized repeat protein (TIGR02543 family)
MRKINRIVAFIICFTIILSDLAVPSIVKGASTVPKETKQVRVYGNIFYNINEDGSKKSKVVRKQLNDYPVTLYYTNTTGETKSFELKTDGNGDYSFLLKDSKGIKKTWIRIESKNSAVLVTSSILKKEKEFKTLVFESRKKTVPKGSSSLKMNINIYSPDAKGAINIARVIKDARGFAQNEMGIQIPPVLVLWKLGYGDDSFAINETISGNTVGGIVLSGKSNDERDESVIAHEYGHWVYGTLREDGRFVWGSHSSKEKVDVRLAYSEGLATFFGQAFLKSEHYVDGGGTNSVFSYSVESLPSIPPGEKNEAHVAAVLWDTIDTYNTNESWDNITEDLGKVLNRNADVVRKSKIDVVSLEDPIHTFLVYNCTIRDFYNKYVESEIRKNSQEALDFWTIFKKNGMQYDDEKPIISLKDNDKVYVVNNNMNSISVNLYDNVTVAKAEFYINGKKTNTYRNPASNLVYKIPKSELKKGLNKLTIKAYDHAGNYVSSEASLAKNVSPTKDFYKISIGNANVDLSNVSYRTPYSVEYIDLILEDDDTPSTLSENIFSLQEIGVAPLEQLADEIQEDETTTDIPFSETIYEIADTYALTNDKEEYGIIGQNEISQVHTFEVENGNDYGLLVDDTLGDFEITLTSPDGTQYTNTSLEEIPEVETSEGELPAQEDLQNQYILNLGTSGFMMFQPEAGVWCYTIKNLGTESNYHTGIFTKLSAPIITNESELLNIQDGSLVELQGNIATGSAISIQLTGENSGIEVVDSFEVDAKNNGNFSYAFEALPDDTYNVELYITEDGRKVSWSKEADIVVDSSVPEIILDDDYEFYTYSDIAVIQGIARNAAEVSVSLNGEGVVVNSGAKDEFTFGTDWLNLQPGNNAVAIIAKTKTGKTAVKELTLFSDTSDEGEEEGNLPVIENVLFNGKEESTIHNSAEIEVKLANKELSNYKVYAIYNSKKYDFIPNGNHFTLNFNPEEESGNYYITIYAESKWQMSDKKEIELTVIKNDGKIYVKSRPEDINIEEGETATLNISDIIGGTNYEIQSDVGNIENGQWKYTPELPGMYEVNFIVSKDETLLTVTFDVIVDQSVGFKLKLNPNGGNLSNNTKYVYYDQIYGVLPTPARVGYTFDGWYTQAEGGEKVDSAKIVTVEDARTLYAHWKGIAVTANLNANGGTVKPTTAKVVYGSEYGELPVPNRENYFFDGWYTALSGGTLVTDNTIVKVTSTHNLYARWTSKTYSITLNPDGGTVTPTTKQVTHGKTYGILSSATKAGYTFDGWFTELGGDIEVTEDTEVVSKSQHSLYAKWNPIDYNIYFNGNGGEVEEASKEVTYGQPYGELTIPERENFEFIGWYTLPVGGYEITEESTVNITIETMLYARWSGVTVKAKLEANGGNVSSDFKQVFYGGRYGALPSPQREGYIFEGWYLVKEGGQKITESTRVNDIKEHTLYAHWTKSDYRVNFNPNGGGVSPANKTLPYNTPYGTLPTPTRGGHTFLGWYTSLSDDAKQVHSDSLFKTSSDQTLYALWKPNQYKVWLNGNGVKTSNEYITLTYGQAYGELPVLQLKNYTFKGWYSEPSGGYVINPTQIFNWNWDQTIYAQWSGKEYTLSFEPEGGSIGTSQIKVNYGQAYGNLPVPYRMGYTFAGWFTTRDGNKMVTYTDIVRLTEDQTLYARWEVIRPTVTFQSNGGMMVVNGERVPSYNTTVAYGGTYGTLYTPVRDGFTFTGWYTIHNNTEVLVTAGYTNQETTSHMVYAKWNANSYEVDFMADDNESILSSMKVTYGYSYGNLPTPTKEHYTFNGWYTKPEGGELINNTSVVNILASQNLYARWLGNYVKVNFNGNGGSVASASSLIRYQSDYGYLQIPSRVGYDFKGWYTEPTGGTKITELSKVSSTEEHTLYARWNLTKITVTLDYGFDGKSSTTTMYYNRAMGSIPIPERPGYRFDGWFARYADKPVTAETVVNTTADFTLYGKWTGNNYQVYLDANGGSVVQNNYTVTNGNSYNTILANPYRQGFTFGGWYSERSGGMLINSGTYVNLTSDTTLYAHWLEETYRIYFYPNGGSLPYLNTTVNKDELFSDFPTPTRTGYSFDGWYNNYNLATPIYYTTGQSNLYAKWTPNSYAVHFEANGGKVSTTVKNVNYDSTYGELPTPTRKGHLFLGWYTQKVGGYKVAPATTMNETKNITLYAQWSGAAVTISYDSNGGSAINSTKTVYYGQAYGGFPTPTRIGYSFEGWASEISEGTLINATSIVENEDAHTLYAQWLPITPTVTLHPVGGTVLENGIKVNISSVIKTYGETYGLLPVPTKTGYIFDGWFTSTTGNDKITEQTIVTATSTITLYAHWKAVENVVTFHPMGGVLQNDSKTLKVTYDGLYGTLPIPEKTGYTFLGWFTEENGGAIIINNTRVTILGNQQLYARWQRKTYSINFDGNGGIFYIKNKAYPVVSNNILFEADYGILPTPTRTGYQFEGWYTSKEDGEEISFHTKMDESYSGTVYARWRATSYDVTLVSDGSPVKVTKQVMVNGNYGELPVPERPYYSFKGWFTASLGGNNITPESIYGYSSTSTLFAQWKPDTFNVTLDPNGGSVTTESIQVAYEGTYGNLPTPTRKNYTFVGWYTSAEDGKNVWSGTVLTIPADITIYARWNPSPYTLTFNANGGYVYPNSKIIVNNENYGELPIPSYNGYMFEGWYTDSSYGDLILDSDLVEVTGAQKLFARWSIKNPAITFNPNGGKVDNPTKTVTYKGTYGDLPTPELSNYSFEGWYTAQTGGTKITENTQVNITDSQTLYARWKANSLQ